MLLSFTRIKKELLTPWHWVLWIFYQIFIFLKMFFEYFQIHFKYIFSLSEFLFEFKLIQLVMGRLEIPVVRIFCLIKILLTLPVIWSSRVRFLILPLFWLSQVLFIQPGSEYWQCSRVFCLVLPPHRSVLIPKRIGCQQDRKLELDWFFEITRSNDKLKLWRWRHEGISWHQR